MKNDPCLVKRPIKVFQITGFISVEYVIFGQLILPFHCIHYRIGKRVPVRVTVCEPVVAHAHGEVPEEFQVKSALMDVGQLFCGLQDNRPGRGLIAGAAARLLVPGKENFGWIATAVLGIAGGWVGGTLGSIVFSPHRFTLQPPVSHAFIGAIIGAVILLVLYKKVAARS